VMRQRQLHVVTHHLSRINNYSTKTMKTANSTAPSTWMEPLPELAGSTA
jgi:hypothetical protein